jgi:hypothetical protein
VQADDRIRRELRSVSRAHFYEGRRAVLIARAVAARKLPKRFRIVFSHGLMPAAAQES